MWTVIGILYIVIGPNLIQVLDAVKYPSPQACFQKAMEVNLNMDIPQNMACIPMPKDTKES
jgi:hypothetical protein